MTGSIQGPKAQASSEEALVEIGWVLKAHGVRGHVVVRTHNPRSQTLVRGLEVALEGEAGRRWARIRSTATSGGDLRLRLAGVDDRDAAEALKGLKVLVREGDLPTPDADEHYVRDLIGMEVRSPEGAHLGTLDGVFDAPGHDVYVIRSEAHGEVLVPAVAAYVAEIDVERRVIVLTGFDDLV